MDWGRLLEIVVIAVALPLLGWIAITLSKINTVLFGATGENGLRGDVVNLRREALHGHGEKIKVMEVQHRFFSEATENRLAALEKRNP